MNEDDFQLDMFPYVLDNLNFLMTDLEAMEGPSERIERAKMYLLKARTELMTEGKERSSE